MANIVIASSALPLFLADLIADTTPIDGLLFEAECELFQNDFDPSPGMVLGDLTVATYSGYALQVIDPWAGPFLTSAGIGRILGPGLIFQPNASTIANTIFGYYVKSAAGALLWARRFETPQVMNGVLTGFQLTPSFDLKSAYAA